MKKLLSILFVSTLLFSCSTDSEVIDTKEQDVVQDLPALVKQGKYDNSNLGIYKGVFTTLDGQNRATVLLELDGKNNPLVSFNFPNGDLKSFRSEEGSLYNKSQNQGAIQFEGKNFSFDFKVNSDGSNPIVSNVTYMGAKGDIIVVKETSKSAVETKTGTYSCLDCSGHPDLGKGYTQTFNSIAQTQNGMGDGATFELQVTLRNWVYYGTMTQNSCVDAARGDITTCQLTGSIDGYTGTATVTGEHQYDNQDPTNFGDCSDLSGEWIYESPLFGVSTMSWESDGPGNCF